MFYLIASILAMFVVYYIIDLQKQIEKNKEYIDLLVDDIAVLWERNKDKE